jgi:hypothetical protein
MSKAWPVEGVDPKGGLAENARRILAVRVAEYYAFAPIVPREEADEALHDLRIAAKRLRYTLELFRSDFGKAGERQIDRVKAIQEELGAIHDHDVRIALIEDELAKAAGEQAVALNEAVAGAAPGELTAITSAALRPPPDDPRRGLIALLGREHEGRRKRYLAFRVLWDRMRDEGMRGDLVRLSAMPLPKPETVPERAETDAA